MRFFWLTLFLSCLTRSTSWASVASTALTANTCQQNRHGRDKKVAHKRTKLRHSMPRNETGSPNELYCFGEWIGGDGASKNKTPAWQNEQPCCWVPIGKAHLFRHFAQAARVGLHERAIRSMYFTQGVRHSQNKYKAL